MIVGVRGICYHLGVAFAALSCGIWRLCKKTAGTIPRAGCRNYELLNSLRSKVLNNIAETLDLVQFFRLNLDAVLIFESGNQLVQIQGIDTEILTERRLLGYACGINTKLLFHNLQNLLKHTYSF